MKTVFVNRFFHPDHSASSQILSELAFELAAQGREVHVVASRQLYENPAADLPAHELISGVYVHRVRSSTFGRMLLSGRAVDYLTFYVAAFWCVARLLRRGDVLVAKTDPPLIAAALAPAVRLRDAILVNWLQDLFPEVAERLGVRVVQGLPGKMLRRLRDASLRSASANVVLGDRMAEVVGAVTTRTHVIHNWAVGEVQPMPIEESELRRKLGLAGRFVVGYSGNLGRAHEFDTILDAMEVLREDRELRFLFIGGGKQLSSFRAEVRRRGLDDLVMFQPYQPVERLSHSLAAANVHLVTLHPSLEGLIVPSKFYGIASAARPIVFIGDTDGEVARLVNRFDCGFAVGTGSPERLACRIRELQLQPERCAEMGKNAFRAHTEQFQRSIAVSQWRRLLDEVTVTGKGSRI